MEVVWKNYHVSKAERKTTLIYNEEVQVPVIVQRNQKKTNVG